MANRLRTEVAMVHGLSRPMALLSFALTSLIGLSLPVGVALASPMSEKLGFGPEEKVLILHVDDLGQIDASNLAGRAAFEAGLATSGSVQVPAPAFGQVPEALKGLSNVDLGVHITLTGDERTPEPWVPAAGAEKVPSLVDFKGRLRSSALQLFMFGKEPHVEMEIEAQVQKAIAAGLAPSHMDTHIGSVFFKPAWFAKYVNTGRKLRVVPMVPRWSKEVQDLMGPVGGAAAKFIKPMLEKVEAAGHLLVDHFHILPFPKKDPGYDARKRQYMEIIAELKPGVTQIILHPAVLTDNFKRYLLKNDPGEMVRIHEEQLLRDPDLRALIKEKGIRLIDWKRVADAYPWHEVSEVSF